MYYIISNIIIEHLRSTRAQFSIIHVMDGQEIEQNLHIESGQSPSYEHAERTEKVKKHQTMTFNQVLFLEKIESIVGVLSFSKRFEGKNYVLTFNKDVSSVSFSF